MLRQSSWAPTQEEMEGGQKKKEERMVVIKEVGFFCLSEHLNILEPQMLKCFLYQMASDSLLVKRQHPFKTVILNMLGKFFGLRDKC